jgi:hypothetical protein
MDLPTPYQSIGAMGINSLSNKLVLALLPPNTPFFRLEMDERTLAAIAQAGAKGDVDQAMTDFENRIIREMERNADRVSAVEAVKQLLVAGNVLVQLPASGAMKVYKLDQYVVKRDRQGNILRIVIKECISVVALPAELQAAAQLELGKNKRVDSTVDIYTVVERQSREHYAVWQEVCDTRVESTRGIIPVDSMSFLALRWNRIDGEDYGRGFVEEYLGDLQSLDGLQKAILEVAALSAKLVILRNPSASTSGEDFASAENGDVVDGLEQDFKAFQANKYPDMRVAMESVQDLQGRLAKAFMLMSSVQRNAERVTAEEIRAMAGELEDSLGGVYSTLTLEFQLPYVRRKMELLQKQNKLPQFPKGTVQPTIVTGIAALGRNHQVAKLMAWAQAGSSIMGPEAFAQEINGNQLLKILGTGYGVQVSEVVKTDEQKAQEARAQQRSQAINTLGPEVVRAQAQKQTK